MKTILLVTDNRYWRDSIGSQKRIGALCRHFEKRYRLHVLFLGKLNAEDARQIEDCAFAYPIEAEPGLIAEGPASTKAVERGVPVRDLARQLVLEVRRAASPRVGVRRGPRHFLLQARESKLQDYQHPRWAERFRAACVAVRPQVVVIEYMRLGWLLEACRDALPAGCRSIIDTHDVQHMRQSMFHAESRVHDIDVTPAEEAAALRLADAVVAIQGDDARGLRALVPEKPVLLAPHPQAITPQAEPPEGGEMHLGFFGSSMTPNVDAARHLLGRLWPAIRRESPEVRLHFFGGVCDALRSGPAAEGVTLHGFVDDLGAAYASLHIVLNPVTYGGGLKIKSVEALGHAKPLVTTAVGAQGLEEGAGQAFVLSRDDEDFVASAVRLLGDASERSRMSQAAVEFARQRFSPEHAFDELDAFIIRP